MRDKIFAILTDTEDFVSGEAISEQLGITRAAVWKHIKALEEEGYEIEAVRKKGYRLLSGGVRQVEIAPYLQTKWLGRTQHYQPEVSSTNDVAKQLAEADSPHGTAVLADRQSSGRGRLGRAWVSPPGMGIWLSVLLRPQMDPTFAPQITLATAVGVAKGLCSLGYEAGIKWPNDILINGKKICGILTEMRTDMDRVHWVVVGIGINAMNSSFPVELQDVATSLAIEREATGKGQAVMRAEATAAVLNSLEEAYDTLFHQGFDQIREEWLHYNVTIGKKVKINTINNTFLGIAKAMDGEGHLIVTTEKGKEKTVVSGDVVFYQGKTGKEGQ